ncbi:MAG: c-type cytochrome [Chloroflexi bacterium]|nr:c-type cytochrome [Chloroflexota bacterium]
MAVLTGSASVDRGRKVYRQAKCFLCHGEAGRGDGEITARLNFEWGLPFSARDLTRGWTFLGGHTPAEIYLRITGGLNGTPMGPYQDLLTEQERWDLAHYVASLDQEANETCEDFLIIAAFTRGKIPLQPEAAEWKKARLVHVPLAGQVVRNPPARWWTPTVGSATVRALWNGQNLGLLVEWNDPTGPGPALRNWADSALVQFAASPELRPHFLFGQADSPVKVWHWQAQTGAESWTATGLDKLQAEVPGFKVASTWKDGRWHVLFQGALASEPGLAVGSFVPTLFSVRDGANGERDNVRAISTWLYTTLETPPSARPWLLALACILATAIAEVGLLSRLRS